MFPKENGTLNLRLPENKSGTPNLKQMERFLTTLTILFNGE